MKKLVPFPCSLSKIYFYIGAPHEWLPKRSAMGVALSEPDCLIIHFALKNSFLEQMPPIIVF